ncbi:hypothetical protein [Litoreibacter janthinus]|uniref:Uncharacterized protein n=1 Tax=Litoreibacter janthinus TaxID=670154 RepID=A0A1I6G022_9RHOB|nr:hypothetical protein [Litoreibacter janthinus]SFR35563.1 hypothetical protein SAMN04488002_0661 [Litoreibacter janthinus]
MSRFLTGAVLAALCSSASLASADGLPAAITPPFPKASLPSPVLPADRAPDLVRFEPPSAQSHDQADPIADIVARQANISNFGTACGPSLSLTVAPDAKIAVRVEAPCLPYDSVRVEHETLSFTAPMSMTGELAFLLPALGEDATVKTTLSDGSVLEATTHVPELRNFARVALQWSGKDSGELVAQAPKALDGEMIRLGQSLDVEGATLHVFSRRINDLSTSGVVRLSMSAQVTVDNCASGTAARVHRVVPEEPVSAYNLLFKGPGCSAIGQRVELKNIIQDLKLTGN